MTRPAIASPVWWFAVAAGLAACGGPAAEDAAAGDTGFAPFDVGLASGGDGDGKGDALADGAVEAAAGGDADAAADVPATNDVPKPDAPPVDDAEPGTDEADASEPDLGPQSLCGDGKCTSPETSAKCPKDCPAPTCGDGFCQKPESGIGCAADCDPVGVTMLTCLKGHCAAAVDTCAKNGKCLGILGAALKCLSAGGEFDYCMQGLAGDGLGKPLTESACSFATCTSTAPSAICGDGVCQPSETSAKCPYDCTF